MNPFYVKSPEGMNAKDVCDLFVESSSDYPMLLEPAHIFLIGPRGTGKSMMFRYMMPDCQAHMANKGYEDLDFFAIYVPLKRQNFNISELARLDNYHASYLINEHLLTTYVGRIFFEKVGLFLDETSKDPEILRQPLINSLTLLGNNAYSDTDSARDLLVVLKKEWSDLYNEAVKYLNTIAFSGPSPYEGDLVNYIESLLPSIAEIHATNIFGTGNVFLLMDDAHNLSLVQTQVLNGWVASRTTSDISIKISTQPNYKTYYTSVGDRVETPHDYTEIRTAEIYTTKIKGRYYKRLESIVRRRLEQQGYKNCNINDYFPEDVEQEKKIKLIADELRQKHRDGQGRGTRASDDALRYARPNYIKDLAGVSKNSSKYSYAGFDQLVHVSSGITRHFLDCASKMYDRAIDDKDSELESIPSSIQNDILREEASELRFNHLSREEDDQDERSPSSSEITDVCHLIDGLGGVFRYILTSERSERRVYSIALSGEPSEKLRVTLKGAVNCGFLHESTIGKKGGKFGGRTKLYVLTRRLAPLWTLDPTGFAGYLFIMPSKLEEAITDPDAFLRKYANEKIDENVVIEQLNLF